MEGRDILGPPSTIGGYIPFIHFPCEKYLGEAIWWIPVLSVLPYTCKLVPWLCCPIPPPLNSTKSISHYLGCEDTGAYYGASIFWTMQGVAIVGLVLALSNFFLCAAEETGMLKRGEVKGTMVVDFNIPPVLVAGLRSSDEEALRSDPTNDDFPVVDASLGDPYDVPSFFQRITKYVMEVIQDNLWWRTKEDEDSPNGRAINRIFPFNSKSSRKRRDLSRSSIPIPTIQSFYKGSDADFVFPSEDDDDDEERCQRDEVYFPDEDDCYTLLSKGPCEDTEYVLMDHNAKTGFCAPRLCSPDRVFVFGDQKCHDPLEAQICPPGRQLFTSSFGTPVCGCPDGTYEKEDDLSEDSCKPVLSEDEDCDRDKVFWFKDFRLPAQCVRDPCGGLNSDRDEDDPPFVPSAVDGKCYQIGKQPSICRTDEWYSFDMKHLKGICSTLEDAGYLILDSEGLALFRSLYGSALSKDIPDLPEEKAILEDGRKVPLVLGRPLVIGQSVLEQKRMSPRMTSFQPTHMNAFSPAFIAIDDAELSSIGRSSFKSFSSPLRGKRSARKKRSIQSYASPGSVFEPALSACRAGAQRDVNSKCREVILPSRIPHVRRRRTTRPTSPAPRCPSGFYNLRRECVTSRSDVETSILAAGLG